MSEPDRKDFEDKLWKTIEHDRTGMLGLVGPGAGHFQPMTAFGEKGEGALWFFVRRDNDLIRQAGSGAKAMFTLSSKDRDLWACIGGELSEQHDQSRIDKYWNPVAAAWFPEGKDDPQLTLLRLELQDAEAWLSTKGPVRFAYEVVKANLTRSEPDVGSKTHLDLH